MSQEHFKGKYEVELKYRVQSKMAFLQILAELKHEVMLENNLEKDHYFDTSDKALAAENKSLCIRTMEPSGIKLWIVKGPEDDRCEATNITDDKSAKSMLENLGYQVVLQAQKTRSIYFVDQFHVTLDTLEGIGDFAEFAIMTDEESQLPQYREQLVELAARFNLTEADRELLSYKTLYMNSSMVAG